METTLPERKEPSDLEDMPTSAASSLTLMQNVRLPTLINLPFGLAENACLRAATRMELNLSAMK